MRALIILTTLLCYGCAHATALPECSQKSFAALKQRHGIAVAVVEEKGTQFQTFGAAREDQIFEIGSITKVFTGLLLAQEVAAGRLAIDGAIPSEFQKPGAAITYRHLTTHSSGIENSFPGFKGTNPYSPHEGLTDELFKKFYLETPLAFAPGEKKEYSNMGVSLLGRLLSERARTPYMGLIQEKILAPLGMNETYFEIPATEAARFAEGHVSEEKGGPIDSFPHWNLSGSAVNPAGGLRSTVRDMAKFARAQLFPDTTPLAKAIRLSQESLLAEDEHTHAGMNWVLHPHKGWIWHNGSTVGMQTVIVLSTKHKAAVVALSDTGVLTDTGMTDDLEIAAFSCLK